MADGIPYKLVKQAIAGAESSNSNDLYIPNPNSSAFGPYQFINDTWRRMSRLNYKKTGRYLNKSLRADHETAMDLLTQENVRALKNAGLPVTPETIYYMHFSGSTRFVNAAVKNPHVSVRGILTNDAIAANPTILKGTVGQAARILGGKVRKNIAAAGGNSNYKSNKKVNMSINGHKNPNYDTAQKISDEEKIRIYEEYKRDYAAALRSGTNSAFADMQKKYYKLGYIGYDENQNPKGFIHDFAERDKSDSQKRADMNHQIKRKVMDVTGKIIQKSIKNVDTSVTGSTAYANQGGKKVIELKYDKELDADITKAVNEIAKLENDLGQGNKTRSYLQKLQSDLKKGGDTAYQAVKGIERYWSTASKIPVNFLNKNGNELKLGSDLDYTEGYLRIKPESQKKGLDFRNMSIPSTRAETATVNPGNPMFLDDLQYDVDGSYIDADYAYDSYDDFQTSQIDYFERDLGTPDPKIAQQNQEYARTGAQNEALRMAQTNANLEKSREEERLESTRRAGEQSLLQDLYTDDEDPTSMMGVDTTQLKTEFSDIPIGEIATAAAGIILGQDMMDEDLPLRDERINNMLLTYVHEAKRMADIGMNPSDEAAAKSALAESYQLGLQNITNASAGNRNLILGNLGRLDAQNAKGLMEMSMVDAEMKQRAFESYGKAMEYINDFEATRSIANNETKAKQAVLRNTSGQKIFSSAFESMMNAIESFEQPDSAYNLSKIQADIERQGFSDKIKEGKGSKAYYDETIRRKNIGAAKEDYLQNFYSNLPPEERNKVLDETAGMGQKAQFDYLQQTYGINPDVWGEITESANKEMTVITTDPITGDKAVTTAPSEATIPMTVNQTVDQNGNTHLVSPIEMSEAAKGIATGFGFPTPGIINQGNEDASKAIQNIGKPQDQIQNNETDMGNRLSIKAYEDQDIDFMQSIADSVGLSDDYNKARAIDSFIGLMPEDEDERYSAAKNIIDKYRV